MEFIQAAHDGGVCSPLSAAEWRGLDQIAWVKGSHCSQVERSSCLGMLPAGSS